MKTSSLLAHRAMCRVVSDQPDRELAWIVHTGLGHFWFLWILDDLIWGRDATRIDNHIWDDESV